MALQSDEVRRLFRRLDRWGPDRFPAPRALSQLLNKSLGVEESAMLSEEQAVLFATAAIEMWQRGIHSLITAVAMSRSSEIWACTLGYYASHYTVRAFAHLFGYFALYRRKLFVEVSPWGARYRCGKIDALSSGEHREHRFYWAVVSKLPEFVDNPLFTSNDDHVSTSDASHRGVASYMDHLNRFVQYEAPERNEVGREIANLARTALDGEATTTIPDREQYPQLGVVLSVAYLRIYQFHEYLDALLPIGGRFWKRQRMPSWCTGLFFFPARL